MDAGSWASQKYQASSPTAITGQGRPRSHQVGEIQESEMALEWVTSVEELLQICPNKSMCEMWLVQLPSHNQRQELPLSWREWKTSTKGASLLLTNFIHSTSTNQLTWLLNAAMTWIVTVSYHDEHAPCSLSAVMK